MTITQITVERFSVISSRSFKDVIKKIEAAISRPDMTLFVAGMGVAKTETELEKIVQYAVGKSNLMEFIRFDVGEVLRKELGSMAPRSLRLVAGNPVIMKQMVKYVPDAASYAPVTILVDERPDGVHLSYDRMAGYLATYGNEEALKVARDLDTKVEALLISAAG